MTKDEALQLLDEAVALLPIPRKDHNRLIHALRILAELESPSPEKNP